MFTAKDATTNVTVNDGTDTTVTELENVGEHIDIVVSSGDERVITSTKPVMVTSFSSQETGNSSMYVCDASLLLLTPIEQMMKKYSLTQAVQEPADTWAVVEDGAEGTLVEAGGSLTWVWEAASTDGTYKTGSAAISDSLVHVSHAVKAFALYQHGSGEDGSSAFSSGMKLCPIAVTPTPGDGYDNDCDGRIDEESSETSDDDSDGVTGEDRATVIAEELTTETSTSTEAETSSSSDDGNSTVNMTSETTTTTTTAPTAMDDDDGDKKWYTNKTIIVLGGCVVGVFVIIALWVGYKMVFPDKDDKAQNSVKRTRAPKVTMVDDGTGKKEEIVVQDYAPMDLPDDDGRGTDRNYFGYGGQRGRATGMTVVHN